jgi:hypothetical protein
MFAIWPKRHVLLWAPDTSWLSFPAVACSEFKSPDFLPGQTQKLVSTVLKLEQGRGGLSCWYSKQRVSHAALKTECLVCLWYMWEFRVQSKRNANNLAIQIYSVDNFDCLIAFYLLGTSLYTTVYHSQFTILDFFTYILCIFPIHLYTASLYRPNLMVSQSDIFRSGYALLSVTIFNFALNMFLLENTQ